MTDAHLLGQLVLAYSPIIDRERRVFATRLTVFPLQREVQVDASQLLDALLGVWPAPVDGGGAQASLNIASEPLLDAVMASSPPSHLMIEVPAFMAGSPARSAQLAALSGAGAVLVVKGRPVSALPREVLPCFRHSIIELGEDQRDPTPPPGVVRTITTLQAGVRTPADVDAAFERGAVAVIGWPTEDVNVRSGTGQVPADVQVVMDLINRVDRQEPVERLEAVLKNDPSLAFRLLRYLNSAAFGLSVEVSSFQHALMLLGYAKLKRWLALLLTSASKDPAARPLMYAAVRRGLLMEELGRSVGDAEMRSEMFVCGVFSLLDRMLGQTFSQLFESVPVPERVEQALVGGSGPFVPYLDLARALEQPSRSDIAEAADRAFLGIAEVNAGLLRALAAARELD